LKKLNYSIEYIFGENDSVGYECPKNELINLVNEFKEHFKANIEKQIGFKYEDLKCKVWFDTTRFYDIKIADLEKFARNKEFITMIDSFSKAYAREVA